MPYRPTEITKQLLGCLHILLKHMTIICGMFSSYLTDYTR